MRKISSTLLWLIALGPSAFAGSDNPFQPVSAEVDARYQRIYKECLAPSFQGKACLLDENETPLKTFPVTDTLSAVFHEDLLPEVGRALKETAWAISLVAYPDQPLYGKERKIGLNFEALLASVEHKAEQESLKSCQRACLATCISSKIISYDFRPDGKPNIDHKQAWGAVETEKGTCGQFSQIARSLMLRMGLDSRIAIGTMERPDGQEGYKAVGEHAMVSVEVDHARYIMEPQRDACVFYNPRFNPTRASGSHVVILEGTGPHQPAAEPASVASSGSSWTKWLDVMTDLTLGVRKLTTPGASAL